MSGRQRIFVVLIYSLLKSAMNKHATENFFVIPLLKKGGKGEKEVTRDKIREREKATLSFERYSYIL